MPVEVATLRSVPVVACTAGDSVVIGTDDGEWCTIDATGTLHALPATGPFSAAIVDATGQLTIGCWEAVVKQLRDGAWSELALGAAPLALAATGRGVVAGDASGGLAIVSARIPVVDLTAPEPVVELRVAGDKLVILGARGALGVTAWPHLSDATLATLTSVDTAAIGRAYAVFPGIAAGTCIVAGRGGLAVLEHERLTAAIIETGDPVRGVVAFRDHGRACVYTDAGDAWIADAMLGRVGRIQLPARQLVGATSAADGSVLAWTIDGALHVISRDGATWRVVERDVVLGAPDPADPHGYFAIHWTAAGGTRVTKGRASWI